MRQTQEVPANEGLRKVFERERNEIAKIFNLDYDMGGATLAIVVVVYQYFYYSGRHINLSDYQELQEGYEYGLNVIEANLDYDEVSGWIVVPGHEIVQYETTLVLYSETGNAYAFPTKMVTRTDVTEYFDDGLNYDASGYQVRVRKSKIKGNSYYIGFILVVDRERYLIKTGREYQEVRGGTN